MVTYWQIASGDRGRDYGQLLLKHGIACVGGDPYIERLQTIEEGDIIVLKERMSKVIAAGIAVKRDGVLNGIDRDWLGDFDGWNLEAFINVEWHSPARRIPVTSGLAMGTIKKLGKNKIRELADHIIEEKPPREVHVRPNLGEIENITDEKIIELLISEGYRAGNARNLSETIKSVRRLANFYTEKCEWESVGEHEARTFLIIPLLMALGWAEQKLKIELFIGDGKRVDIATFSNPYIGYDWKEEKEDCEMIIESKAFHHGLDTATDQALAYGEAFPNCEHVIVSNGFCYKAFKRKGKTFSKQPVAYMNLLKPTNKHPLYFNAGGTLELFEILLP